MLFTCLFLSAIVIVDFCEKDSIFSLFIMNFVVVPGDFCDGKVCPPEAYCVRMEEYIEPLFCYNRQLPLTNLSTAACPSPPITNLTVEGPTIIAESRFLVS